MQFSPAINDMSNNQFAMLANLDIRGPSMLEDLEMEPQLVQLFFTQEAKPDWMMGAPVGNGPIVS
eukprot:CAMPEP_0168609456 /NCGR_PEP_ID=MMETSP0449_2-20121227/1217_1 /TAXON_ID=1082188 /ORGANISM="Strombidium rassoulzadegani, Strain ras09" /LENGTH=64 /DNA_ID=CAMNT_0008649603 /DNA_START=35 /DNA_END=229 /DNA_ORIENTATION=-